jgi:hypothetical protein
MVFSLEGIARLADLIFCFLVNADSKLLSGFLFFTSTACACLSLKLHGMMLMGVIPGRCVLGWESEVGPRVGGGGLCEEFPWAGMMLAVLGDGPNLNTSWGCGTSWAGGGVLLTNAALMSI